MSRELEMRIIELETRLEFQDATIASLNDAIVAQGARLSDLKATVDLLIEKYREAQRDDDEPFEQPDPPPPHY